MCCALHLCGAEIYTYYYASLGLLHGLSHGTKPNDPLDGKLSDEYLGFPAVDSISDQYLVWPVCNDLFRERKWYPLKLIYRKHFFIHKTECLFF